MGARANISRVFGTVMTSRPLTAFRRWRGRRPGPPTVDYFHQADDPYSHVAVQLLDALAARYGLAVRTWLVPPPADSAAPERQRLRELGVRDAAVLAKEYGLSFPAGAVLPDAERAAAAAAAVAPALGTPEFAAKAVAVGEALWTGGPLPNASADAVAALAAGEAERTRLRHYLGATFYFDGEWYWGVDRLNHLEERLAGRDTAPAGTPPLAPYRDIALDGAPREGRTPVIEYWFSFRSPYTWISFPRVRRLAETYGAELRLRYILPMVMRGLPVPGIKSFYILLDTKREADRVGLPFGRTADPVGPGAERALAVAHYASSVGKGVAFSEGALRAAWAEGVDLATDRGLYGVARAAGLTDTEVKAALADEAGWRARAEENRQALFDAGLWGAPSYRVNGGDAHWGQDRLWALEADLKAALAD